MIYFSGILTKTDIMCDSKKIECPRCGGSGKTEFSHVVYGVCFMCSGGGEVFPKRVAELTEKANIRKANKEAKRLAEDEAIELRIKEEENKYQEWQYNRNLEYFNAQKNIKTKGSEKFMKGVLGIRSSCSISAPAASTSRWLLMSTAA